MTSIVVRWGESTEVVPLDTNAPEIVSETTEFWDDYPIPIPYRVQSALSEIQQGVMELVIQYLPEINPEAKRHDVPWGSARIILSRGATRGTAYWRPRNKREDPKPSQWTLNDGGVTAEIERQATTRVKRQQQKFRTRLIKLGCSACVISGETTLAALHAAHVVDAAKGGGYGYQDGVLLRADLHALFDARYFRIDPRTGDILLSKIKPLSETYRTLLLGKARIDESNRKRIEMALQTRSKGYRGKLAT